MRQNKLCVYLHLVWATWNRMSLIDETIERELYRYLSGVCQKNGCDVLAINGMAEHLHVLIKLPSTITIADLVEQMKGGSSRYVSETLRPGEWFKWQGNYGAFSVSPQDKLKVLNYILNQKRHHSEGTLWLGAETSVIEKR